MGDRGNVCVRQEPHDVWLYTHSSGTELADTVRAALAKKWRWNDEMYLTRIIFEQMIDGAYRQDTGFGIGTKGHDNNHPVVYVDPDKQTVTISGEVQSFEQFIDVVTVEQGG